MNLEQKIDWIIRGRSVHSAFIDGWRITFDNYGGKRIACCRSPSEYKYKVRARMCIKQNRIFVEISKYYDEIEYYWWDCAESMKYTHMVRKVMDAYFDPLFAFLGAKGPVKRFLDLDGDRAIMRRVLEFW